MRYSESWQSSVIVVTLAAFVMLLSISFLWHDAGNDATSLQNSALISPTAHYTGYIWVRNGLSEDVFVTHTGVCMYWMMEPFARFSQLLGMLI
jgi:hypothetical protein